MNVDLKIDLSKIISALIIALAAVSVAQIIAPSIERLAPKRYAPVGMGDISAGNAMGFYLDAETGLVGFGPVPLPKKK